MSWQGGDNSGNKVFFIQTSKPDPKAYTKKSHHTKDHDHVGRWITLCPLLMVVGSLLWPLVYVSLPSFHCNRFSDFDLATDMACFVSYCCVKISHTMVLECIGLQSVRKDLQIMPPEILLELLLLKPF